MLLVNIISKTSIFASQRRMAILLFTVDTVLIVIKVAVLNVMFATYSRVTLFYT